MKRDVARWLCGQISVIRVLAEQVESTVRLHDSPAAKELEVIRYACNRSEARIHAQSDAAAEAGGETQ
jgi:hypothetical protein